MNPFYKALAAALACVVLSTPAVADPAPQHINFTVSGLIEQGRDDLHLFTSDPVDLFIGGLPFTLSMTVDTGDLHTTQSGPEETDMLGWYDAWVKTRLTVNGKTLNAVSDSGLADIRVRLPADWYLHGSTAFMQVALLAPQGFYIKADSEARSFDVPLSQGTDPFTVSLPANTRGIFFTTNFSAAAPGGSPGLETWFTASGATQASWTVTPVPEPGQYAMLAVGIGVLGAARRRNRRARGSGNK